MSKQDGRALLNGAGAQVVFTRAILRAGPMELLRARAGGMRVLERQLFTAARAGIEHLWIASPEPAAFTGMRVPPTLEVRWGSPEGAAVFAREAPCLEISGGHLIKTEILSGIARRSIASPMSFTDASGVEVIRAAFEEDRAAARVLESLPEGACVHLTAPLSQGPIVDWLMAAGPKPQDGFMARHFDRRLSLAVSRALIDTSVTPNQMTAFSTMIGLTGASFFLGDIVSAYVTGALLIWLHSVLDGCDGELARVRFQESSLGSDLDFWGDNLVHFALFSCLGIGFWLSGNGVHTLILGAVAGAGGLASAGIAWSHRLARRNARSPEAGVVEQAAGDGLDSLLSRVENTLAQRDFIYLLVALAFVDMVYEFLWASAIGGGLFFAVMLHLKSISNDERARQSPLAR